MEINKFKRVNFFSFILLLCVIFLISCGKQESTQSNSSTKTKEKEGNTNISIATHPQGSTYNTIGTAVASVISKNSSVKTAVTPYSGPNAWVTLLNEGEVELGIISGPDVAWAYEGDAGYKQNENARVLVRGNDMRVSGFVVREDSGIEKMEDLKGKKVSSDYAGNIIIQRILEAELAAVDLTWDDVSKVPVSSSPDGMKAMQSGKADAVFGGAPTMPDGMEVHNAIGIKSLNFANVTPETVESDQIPVKVLEELQKRLPNSGLEISDIGYLDGKKTTIIYYPLYLAAYSELSDDSAYEIVKTLWENNEEMHSVHPMMKEWVPDQMFDPNPPVPYHSGAIKFFKEIDIWTDEAQQHQDELIKASS